MNPLFDNLNDVTPKSINGKEAWYVTMQRAEPQKYLWMLELVQDFNAKGITRTKLPSITQLYEYIKKHQFFPRPISEGVFRAWVRTQITEEQHD